MENRLIECVPNFSEGNDDAVIRQITSQIEAVEGARLLDVDPGQATNRTVVTFAGTPKPVLEAAFRAVRKAAELIDMSKHRGEHPRFGASDVCPLIPLSGITMDEVVELAHDLARRIGEELEIPVYCYEYAATSEERRNLASVRAGEYEGLADKLRDPAWKPDFGPAVFNPRSGATAVGARDFLVAYNINLNTTSTRRANAVAFDIREKGRIKREGDPLTGEIVRDEDGQPVWIPGSLKAVKGIGWYIEEYGIAQVSVNLTNLSVTPVHVAFDETCRRAEARGLRVTGSELVGLIPLDAMLEAGKYFLRKQKRSLGVSDRELVKIAVKSLGLNDLYEFKPEEKIIEYLLADKQEKRLVGLSVEGFVEETASESPAPGGGSVAACLAALGGALGTMVANLSSHKRGWDDRWQEFSDQAEKGKAIQNELVRLVDEDTRAFNELMESFRLPEGSEAEKVDKEEAVQAATRNAVLVPLRVMETAVQAFEVLKAMAESGIEASVSDAGVGALAVRAGIRGAFLNVRINLPGVTDPDFVEETLEKGRQFEEKAAASEEEILELVREKLGQ